MGSRRLHTDLESGVPRVRERLTRSTSDLDGRTAAQSARAPIYLAWTEHGTVAMRRMRGTPDVYPCIHAAELGKEFLPHLLWLLISTAAPDKSVTKRSFTALRTDATLPVHRERAADVGIATVALSGCH